MGLVASGAATTTGVVGEDPPSAPAGCNYCGLGRLCFPGQLAGDGQRAHGLRIRRIRLAPGKALYRRGDRVESLFMVRSGCIRETDESHGAPGAIIGFALPGEMLSLQCLAEAPSTTSGVAVTASHVCVVPWESFCDLSRESPQVATDLVRLVAEAAAAARELLAMTRDRNALGRVSGFLLNLSVRLQKRGVRGREFRLAMNRDDIASYLGLRSETVSRCLTELFRRNLVRVRAKRVQILNPAGMRKVYHES